eukprot:2159151-Amphidinium_carterae.1
MKVQRLPQHYRRGDEAAISATIACLKHAAGDVRSASIHVLQRLSIPGSSVITSGGMNDCSPRQSMC